MSKATQRHEMAAKTVVHRVPGMEAAGEVIDIGEDVIGVMPGDRVAYACPPVGAYTQVRTMKADQLVVLPADIDDHTAAAAMLSRVMKVQDSSARARLQARCNTRRSAA